MEKKGLYYLQRALRVNGYKSSDCNMRKDRAQEGGSPNHCDGCDFPHKIGNIILYLNPFEETFKGTDLIVFNNNKGKRDVRIPTMMHGWISIAVLPSLHCLHGSVILDTLILS
eukprot:15364679-Ditylum_brightwellii.AAC.1